MIKKANFYTNSDRELIEIGRKEGREEGREEGIKENTREIVINMYNKNFDLNIISEITRIPVKEVEEILRS